MVGSISFVGEVKEISGSKYILIPHHFFKQGMIQNNKLYIQLQDVKTEHDQQIKKEKGDTSGTSMY